MVFKIFDTLVIRNLLQFRPQRIRQIEFNKKQRLIPFRSQILRILEKEKRKIFVESLKESKNHKLEKLRIKLEFVQGFDYRRSVDKSVLINQVRKHLLVDLSHFISNFYFHFFFILVSQFLSVIYTFFILHTARFMIVL